MRNLMRYTTLAAMTFVGFGGRAAIAAPSPAGNPPPAAMAPAAVANLKSNTEQEALAAIERRIKDLHTKLHISNAQQPQWDGFAQVMRDNVRAMDQTFQQRVKTMASMKAPENMQSYAQVAMDHAQQMQKLVPAFQAVYDVMSDSQKKLADQVFRADAHRGDFVRRG